MKPTPLVDRRFGASGLWLYALLPGVAVLIRGFLALTEALITELLRGIDRPKTILVAVIVVLAAGFNLYILLGVARVAYESRSVVQRIWSEADKIRLRTYWRRVFEDPLSDIHRVSLTNGPSLWVALSLLSRDKRNAEIELVTGRKFYISGSVDGLSEFLDSLCSRVPPQ
jgi:hypothetical protein